MPPLVFSDDLQSSNIKTVSKTVEYSNIDIYPEQLFSFRTAGGLKGEERVTYLTVNLYPVQYKPNENKIYYYEDATIDIKYTLPENPLTFGDAYDL